ncbi:transcriptional regulator, TetR family [Agrobacterium fabrum]|uniref:TetR family transcriptional regulator n=1 Tax=Agrobacterium fabrum TaxID=1176649 RepID=UPI00087E61D6|nr:TetR family transcriptional regulator [Agrobacterium fabrum]SDB74410.1 transcriptional regulator, TetR family [Agrobacterium fabrum]SES24355.1 transcriptional regulator, TetR family [Agrobacterium fabrum]
MTKRATARISSRKQPRQARSQGLVAAILEAAIRVLAEEGAQRFTTARVAEKAGVSVGSLYQYFPNKASILYRLQSDEWRQTTEQWRTLLSDQARPPAERLRNLVHSFLHSEVEEAEVRLALDDAAPLYRDAAEAQEIHAEGDRIIEAFMVEALPGVQETARQLAGDLIVMTMTAVGKELTETPQTRSEIDTYADAMSDMFVTYLNSLRQV